jgi:SnoaL-like domain
MITLSDNTWTECNVHDKGSVQKVFDFIAAVRDQRIKDMLALVDPEIICVPLVRPGLSVYEGHDGMACFVSDMHAAFGRYQFEIDKITERDGAKLAVQTRILPESGRKPMPPTSILIIFTLCDGLITFVEGEPATGTL